MSLLQSPPHYQTPMPAWLWSLYPLTLGYRLGLELRQLAYQVGLKKSYRPSVPVVSIGNLTTGGTGKTPIVEAIARYYLDANKRVVILSRGYGASTPQQYARATEPEFGDEAYQLQLALPSAMVIVGAKRALNAKRAIEDYRPDVILMDDGFQHWPLDSTCHVVLVDSDKQFGNQQLLPMGPLREPLQALKRADVLIMTRCCQQKGAPEALARQLSKIDKPIVESVMRATGLKALSSNTTLSPNEFEGHDVMTVCGLGQPAQFEATVRNLGMNVKQTVRFADHHVYTPDDFEQLQAIWESLGRPKIITTLKDAVKWQAQCVPSLLDSEYALLIEASIDGLAVHLDAALETISA